MEETEKLQPPRHMLSQKFNSPCHTLCVVHSLSLLRNDKQPAFESSKHTPPCQSHRGCFQCSPSFHLRRMVQPPGRQCPDMNEGVSRRFLYAWLHMTAPLEHQAKGKPHTFSCCYVWQASLLFQPASACVCDSACKTAMPRKPRTFS